MSTSLRRFAALLLAAAVLGGACSDGGEEAAAENPKQALSDALDAFADYEGVTIEMTLQADPAELAATDDTPEDVAEAIVNSSLTVSLKGVTPEESQAEFTVNVDGNEDAVQLRVVDQSFYARADVRELVEAFGGDAAEIDDAVEQASAAGFDFARALVDGEWVGVEGLADLAQQLGVPQATPDPEQAAAFADSIAGILEQNARVTSEGTDDVGAHLVVAVPLRETAQEVFEVIQSFGGAAAGALPEAGLEEIPDADVPIDAWISDGRLVQIELDFVTIASELGEEPPEGIDELGLRMAIEEFTEDVEAPEDFVGIDLQRLLQGFFGAATTEIETPESGMEIEVPGDREVVVPELGLACSDLAMLEPAQIESFLQASGQAGALKKIKKECPELF